MLSVNVLSIIMQNLNMLSVNNYGSKKVYNENKVAEKK
jgi:hypothetical protein